MLTNRKYTLLAVLLTFVCYLGSTGQDVGCDEQWFDSGGESGNYSNNELTTTTFCPDGPDEVVTLTFTYVDIETSIGTGIEGGCWDFIEVFDGPDTSSPSLGIFCGEESGDGGVPSVPSSLLSVGDGFTATNAEGCLTVVFDSDGSVTPTGWEALVTCSPAPDCVPPQFSIETERDCDDLSYAATISIDEASPTGLPLLIATAELDGIQLGGSAPFPNLPGQSVEIAGLPLDENVIISVNVLGATCPSFEIIEVVSNGCPIPLTCGEGIENTYCYENNDDEIWLYESPDDEPVTIVFLEGLIATGDIISIYDGVDNTGIELFSGTNNNNLFGLEVTAPSGDLFIEVDASAFGSCATNSFNTSPWTWIVGCGDFDVPGCTDPDGLNFLPAATIDDGSCIFPPENDDVCDALPIECGVPVDGLTLSATEDGLEQCGGSSTTGSLGAGVWYEFTPTFDAIASFSTCNDADFDTQILIFSADDCTDELMCVDGDDDNFPTCTGNTSEVSNVDIFVGQTYFVFVGGFGSAEGFFTLSIECEEVTLDCEGLGDIGTPCDDGDDSTEFDSITEDCDCVGSPRPAGEVCGISIDVAALPYFTSDATNAYVDDYDDSDVPPLTEDGILVGAVFSTSYLNSNEVVYAYTPAEDQLIDVLLENVGNETGVYVFTGCDFESTVASHTAVAGGIREIEALPVTAGTTYYVAIGTSTGANTDYDLSIFLNTNDCENLGGDIGDPCDDGDPFTTNDLITANCECIGTPTVQGQICENPIPVTALPYTASDNTANYVDDYDFEDVPELADDAIVSGTFFSEFYFSGDEVFYAYTPTEDQIIDVVIDNVGGFAGLFIFTGCPFESTVGAHTNFDGDSREVIGLPVMAGVTYYVAIAADAQVQSTPYDLSITVNTNDCTELGGDFGDSCDDGDDSTINDAITEDCECEGTPEPLSQCGFLSSSPDNLTFGASQQTVTDTIAVTQLEGTVLDLNVIMQINHTYLGDIVAKLTSPSGTEVDLVPFLTCFFGQDVEILLDDDGPQLSCDGATPGNPALYGTFAPEGSLADFIGEPIEGNWILELTDLVPSSDDGTLVTWCLSPTIEFTGGGDDECDEAALIVATPEFAGSETAASMVDAVPSGEAQCINADNPQSDMWFAFESVTTNMYIRAWGLNDFDAAVEVYDECGGQLLNCQNDEPAGEREVVQVTGTTVGETYYFRVYHAGDVAPTEQNYTVAVAHIPFTQLSADDCGVTDYTPADMITTDLPVNQFLLTNWYFEFTELEAPFNTYEILSPNGANPNFMLEWFPQAEYGRTYEVRTRARMYQGPQWGDYGDACTIGFNSEPLTTQLIEEQALGFYDMCDILEADNVPGAETYRWKFYTGYDSTPLIYDSPNRFCQLDLVEGLQLGSPYAVVIRVLTQGIVSPNGEIRLIAMNNFVPDTELDGAITDCGSTLPLNTVVSAVNICAAEFYTFRFTNISDANQADIFFTRDDGLRSINLNSVVGLIAGDTYSVQVLGGSGGLVGEYGDACEITIAGSQSIAEFNTGSSNEQLSDVAIELYPNPTTGEEVMMNLTNLSQEQQEVMVEIYDLYGKKVHAEILGNNGSQMNAVIQLPELASGIYTVNVVVNEVRVGAKKLVVR